MYRHKIKLVIKSRELLGYLNGKMKPPVDLSIGKDMNGHQLPLSRK
jgi:hypothetical protein